MKLSNFIKIADKNITIAITGIRPDREKIGYDFCSDEWLDCNKMGKDRLISVNSFVTHPLYKIISSMDINFSVFNNRHISTLKELILYRETVVIIEVFLIPEKFPFVKEFTQKNKNAKRGIVEDRSRGKYKTHSIFYKPTPKNTD